MQNLSIVEKEIFSFLRNAFRLNKVQIKNEFIRLHAELKSIKDNPQESRSFMYLDILSWLESKIKNIPVQEVIHQQFKSRAKG
jgi:hypothetical protein